MKPRLDPKRHVPESTLVFRVRRHCEANNMLAIKRTKAPVGPHFVLSLKSGKLVHRNVETLGELARRLGLLQPWERAS